MVRVTNGDELHREVYEQVLARHLRVGDFGPAEYFTQKSDRMTRAGTNDIIGFDVTLSGLSVTARRAQKDFWDGLEELHRIYSQVASEHLVPELRAQVFTRMALDKPIEYFDRSGSTSLLENGPTLVDGSAIVKEASMAEVIRAEMEVLVGDRITFEGFMTLLHEGKGSQIEDSHRVCKESSN